MRFVVLLCGPPGAGKTTAARASGLAVFDSDEPRWSSRAEFTAALTQLGATPDAQAVVIRTAPTSASRAAVAATVGATHVYVLTEPTKVLNSRVMRRGRRTARNELAAIARWNQQHERLDGAPDFPGWDSITADEPTPLAAVTPEGATVRDW